MMASGQPSGAAQRRRQRRLRSWWRHEQQSIAAALAAATHHSAQQNGALRSQRTATTAREEAGSETYHAPRGLKTLPPGTRPAPPSEVAGPQGAAATVGYVAAGASLAGRDDVDEAAEEGRGGEGEEAEAGHEARMRELDHRVRADEQLTPAESYAWCKWAGFLPSEPRRKKKRKKKKTSSCSSADVPALFSDKFQQSKEFYRFVPQIQFISRVWDIPVVEQRQVRTVLNCA